MTEWHGRRAAGAYGCRVDESILHREVHNLSRGSDTLETDATTVAALSRAGRLRWKIENEGFNDQKNHGYALERMFPLLQDTFIRIIF
ncbi:MAG: hypothetical protein GY927_14305 [bacterium]|nr:hypothetical protein [bacterium]